MIEYRIEHEEYYYLTGNRSALITTVQPIICGSKYDAVAKLAHAIGQANPLQRIDIEIFNVEEM